MIKELEKEILKIRIELEKSTNKEIKKILLEKKKYLEQLRKEIGSLYMEYGENLHMSDVERFNIRRKFESQLKDIYKGLTPFEVGIVAGALSSAYKQGYYKTAYTLDKGLSINVNYKILRDEFIDSVVNANFEGQVFSDRIWKNQAKLINELYDVIGKGIYEGQGINKISKAIKDKFGVSAYESTRLARTESARVVTNATEEIYRDSGVVDRVMYIATLDNLTSQICQERDSSIWELNNPNKPTIPAHPNCRSTWVSYLPEWNPKTRRDNQAKQNIDFTNYNNWAKDNNIS